MSKLNNYNDIGFDCFLSRGIGSVGSVALTLSDLTNTKQSGLNQNSNTEKLTLGQSNSMSVSDGRNLRIVIGKR